jgi:hypothetical protein
VYDHSVSFRKGKVENLPYSLSRWTDVPAAKWAWFTQQLNQGWMTAFDQRTSLPAQWSLTPDDTLGLIFWTKDPTNLLRHAALLEPYKVKVHVTVTGWEEVEKGAPGIFDGAKLLRETAQVFGPKNVVWRFSPVPMVSNVSTRFAAIAAMAADAGVGSVYISFLQANDLLPETRSEEERKRLLNSFAEVASTHRIGVHLCNEDRLLVDAARTRHWNLSSGVCAPPEDFALASRKMPPAEGCGCVMAVDPFTINESCTFGCQYCYAASNQLTPKKRNTTRSLPVLQGPR